MIQVLIHSSKTMRIPGEIKTPLGRPQLLSDTKKLARDYGALDLAELATLMAVSPKKAEEVRKLQKSWSINSQDHAPAIDAFVGDIYSGLQVRTWSDADRQWAHDHLLILSGLYGALRACDGILPYRLEMGYKLPTGESLYSFWGDKIAGVVSAETTHIINLSAVEYTKAVLPYIKQPVTTPRFLTRSPKTGEPTFVTVHTKIARGAFARWMIQQRVDDPAELRDFTDLGYAYDQRLSTDIEPVFVCDTFQGIGLSVRLTK